MDIPREVLVRSNEHMRRLTYSSSLVARDLSKWAGKSILFSFLYLPNYVAIR